MSEFIVIRLRQDRSTVDESAIAGSNTEWVRVSSDGAQLSHVARGSLQDIAAEIAALPAPVIALLPATQVLTTSVNIPIRSAAKIRAALPFALEESLAEDVENLHFAAGEKNSDGHVAVAVIATDVLKEWLQTLHAVDIHPTRLIAENHGLAKISGTLSILVDGTNVMFNDGDATEFVMQDVKPSDVLVVAGELDGADDDDEGASRHLVAFCSAHEQAQLTHDWTALRQELSSVDVTLLPDGALPKLATTVARGNGVNLLQGRFGAKTEYAALFRPWRNVAGLLIGVVFLALAAKGIDYYRLLEERGELQAQFSSEYQRLQPGDNRSIADPLAVARNLRGRFATSDAPQVFLPSMKALGTAVAANSDADIEAISYRAGVIDIRLSVPDVASLDAIEKAVTESGRFRASIQSTDQVADRINGRLQVREAGS